MKIGTFSLGNIGGAILRQSSPLSAWSSVRRFISIPVASGGAGVHPGAYLVRKPDPRWQNGMHKL
jgi:hypothetical protein